MSAQSTTLPTENTRPTGSGPVILMQNVTVGSLLNPRAVVADGVNWQVEAGEFWAVAGLQGAGKTAFMMLAGGVLAQLSGRYEFMGEAMPIFSDERLAHRLKLGLVFDGGCLFNHLTVAENIALPLQYHRNLSAAEAEPLLAELLELTGMTQFGRKRPSALGRSWHQRAALARALALKPEVLLLDSPLSGLDQRQQNWWVAFLSRLAKGHPYYDGKPVTLIVSTDNLWAWRSRASRFALLDEQRFTVIGEWTNVEQSRDPLVLELLSPAHAANI